MMRTIRSVGRRLWSLWAGRRPDRALEEEVRSHVELHVDEQTAAGMPLDEARRTALLRLGGVAQAIELAHDQRSIQLIDGAGSDLRLAWRRLARAPAFTVTAVATLALGIGATSAMFSVARAALATPLPYPDPDRRVEIFSRWTAFDKTWVADAEIMDYRAMARTLSAVAAWQTQPENLTGDGRPERVTVGYVTANTFLVLGVEPKTGRAINDEDDRPHAAPVVVISDTLWRTRYGSDPGMVGRTILLDDEAVRVVGVMPAGFRLPTDYTDDVLNPSQAWRALQLDENDVSRGHGYYAAALLAPGQTAQSATAELGAIARRLTEQGMYPESMRFTAFAVSLDDEIRGPVRPALWLLTAGVACLLLIACANVGNLLLVRGEAHQKELTVRRALGASSWRLRRQLLLESLLLTAAGTLTGVPLALALISVAGSFDVSTLQAIPTSHMDWRMTLVAFAAAAATTTLFGMAPLIGPGSATTGLMRGGGPTTTAGPGRTRTRRALVLAQVSLAMMLLASAGLLIRSLDGLRRIDLGFNPAGLLTARVALPERRYATPAQVIDFYLRVSEEAAALPGVTAAGVVRLLPLASTIGDWGLDIEGYDESNGQNAKGDWQVVTPGAFAAMGTKLIRGRLLLPADRADTELVAVVNETLARTYWRSLDDALNGRLRVGSASRPWVRVVGIVADEHHNGITGAIKEKFYIPHSQWHRATNADPIRDAYIVVRTSGDPAVLAQPLTQAVQKLDPDLPVTTPREMTAVVTASLGTARLSGLVLSGFAAAAVLLAGIGLYGVLAHVVSRRTKEIGIRLALGSEPRAIVRLVLEQGLGMAGVGVATGTIAGLAVTRLLRGLLYQVEPSDPLTFATVAALLMFIALLACAGPGLRAARTSPLIAIREE